MSYRFSFKDIFSTLFCLIFIGFISHNSYAEVLTKQSIFKIEAEANRLGKIWNGDKIRRSILLFKNAANNWKEINELERASHCLRESARLSILVSDYDVSITYLEESLLADKRIKNIEGQVISHALLSQIEELKGNLPKSSFHYKKALALSETSTDHAIAIANLYAGRHVYYHENLMRALEHFEKALFYSISTEDVNLQASILLELGSNKSSLGEIDEGINNTLEALYLWQKLGKEQGVAIAYNRLGFIYLISDEKQKSIDNYLKAKSMFPDNIDFIEQGIMFSGIASFYLGYGQLDLAEENFKLALNKHQKSLNITGQIAASFSLAKTLYLQGNKVQSKKLYIEALNLSLQTKNKILEANIIEDYGFINLENGNYDEAIKEFNRANAIYSRANLEIPRIQNNLGKALEKKGDFKSARLHYKTALEIGRRTRDTLEAAESLHSLANLSKIDGRIVQALKESSESLQLTENINNDVDNQNLRKSFVSNSYDRYELHINLLMQMHEQFPTKGFEIKALQTSEKSRSRIMLENLHFANTDLTLDADPKTLENEIKISKAISENKEKLSVLTDKYKTKEIHTEIEIIELELNSLQNELENIRADLRSNSPIYSSLKNLGDFEIGSFQTEILDEDSVLIEFYLGKEKSYLWLISKTNVQVYTLPKAEVLDSEIDSLIKLLIPNSSNTADNIEEYQENKQKAETKYWRDAKEFSELIFGQITSEIEGKRLLIVADGKLRYLPISALPHPNKLKNTPFLLTNEIIYQPSATMLHLLKIKKPQTDIPPKDFFIVSDPVYSFGDERLEKPKQRFKSRSQTKHVSGPIIQLDNNKSLNRLERLEATELESESIIQMFGSNNSDSIKGFSANRQAVLSHQLDQYKVLHFATHGVFNEKFPDLSGIVLSQYDKEAKRQNGLIWLQDIYRLKLSSDLVVLSACDTGVGENVRGEGLQSLTNGFLQVGAKSVISSHWKVEDQATLELMKNFYEILAEEDISSSQALQKAKIRLFENDNYRFPYYWSSFTISGDFQNRPNLTRSSNYTMYISVLLIVLAFLGFYFGIKKSQKVKSYFKTNG